MNWCAVLILSVGIFIVGAVPESRLKREFEKGTNVRRAVNACHTYTQLSEIVFEDNSAEPNYFWMAALGYFKPRTNSTSFECAGTIISNDFILTAAHCVRSSKKPTVVRLGSKTLADGDGHDYRIQEILRHPEYLFATKKNNIALIRTTEPIRFTVKIRPACLHTDSSDVDSTIKLIVTGWGYTPEFQYRAAQLKIMNVNTIPLSECNATMIDFNRVTNFGALRNGIIESQYCTTEGRNGPCLGDGGGPLQYFPTANSTLATVVGIVSLGIGCGNENPSIYTRVAFYIDWIESNVWP